MSTARAGRRAALLAALILAGSPLAVVHAEPAESRVVAVQDVGPQQVKLVVHSAAMDSDITVKVLRPRDTATPSPTLYLLSGVEGASDQWGWLASTDATAFFADKQVNVVVPYGGSSSYYTDWRNDDPNLGRYKWKTFLTEELPPLIDAELNTTGRNAIVGMSMSAYSSLALAVAAPKLYRAVGSFSGCASNSDPLGMATVAATVADFYGNPLNLWGPPGDPAWADNDPSVHAERLRGIPLYITTGSGRPGPHETIDSPWIGGSLPGQATTVVKGGMLEAVVDACTRQFAARLADLGIPATVVFRPEGVHAWAYWQDDLHNSWPMIAAALAGSETGTG